MRVLFNLDELKSWKRMVCLFTIIGSLIFFILIFVAMITYPVPYSFCGHFLSTLGKTHTDFGMLPNPISSALFIIALIMVGITFIPFWVTFRTIFYESEIKDLNTLGSIFGIVSSFFLIGVAIFPGNVQKSIHTFFAVGFFLLFTIAIFLYTLIFFYYEKFSHFYAYYGVVVLIITFFNFFSPIARPLLQKITTFGFFSWVAIQIIKIWKSIDTKNN